jgi:hypothetical protein
MSIGAQLPHRRIQGDPGSDSQGTSPGEVRPKRGTAPSTGNPMQRGILRRDGDDWLVEWNGQRIYIDRSSLPAIRDTPSSGPRRRGRIPAELEPALDTVRRYAAELRHVSGVVAVRAGYHFEAGRITREPAVVVSFAGKRPQIPTTLDGVPVDAVPADPYEMVLWKAQRAGGGAEALRQVRAPRLLIDELQDGQEVEEMTRVITYKPPRGASLPEVEEALTITCHVSPDAGFGVLQPFLQDTRRDFVLGMYDFTAPHIYKTVRSLLRDSDVKWDQTLGPNEALPGEDDVDSNKADDLHEDAIVKGLTRVARDRFRSAFASVGSGKTFASAYHIKVGVRDRSAFWLSSGNWQSSNQPDIDFLAPDADRKLIASFNREWHVVVENERLAGIFRTYLEGDLNTAMSQAEAAELVPPRPELLIPESELLIEERAAQNLQVFAPQKFTFSASKPLRVQPILTPDNYIEVIRDLLRRRPKNRLYFQNQSLNPVKQPTDEYAELMQLIVDYSNDQDLDVRIIFRNIGPVRKKLESLQAAGFNMSRIRMQAGCHTKGIIVDSETVLLGSHNFTNDGVQFNRDASLLIHDPGIAKYYEDVFLHDWERLARPTMREDTEIILADSREAAPRGYARVPWSAYDEEA